MNEDLEQLLQNLKLKTIAARFDEMLAGAEQNGTPVQTLVTQLLRAEWHARQEKALQARIDRADFAELDFIPKAENIVFIGETGVGKTGLMVSLARKAVQNGYRALFITAQDLLDDMYASLADRSSRRLLKTLANVDVLAIDELGYVNIKPEQTNIFFKLMEERHRRKPTLITTNLPYSTWPDFLANPALTKALLSRLRERCHTIIIDGPCIRPQTG